MPLDDTNWAPAPAGAPASNIPAGGQFPGAAGGRCSGTSAPAGAPAANNQVAPAGNVQVPPAASIPAGRQYPGRPARNIKGRPAPAGARAENNRSAGGERQVAPASYASRAGEGQSDRAGALCLSSAGGDQPGRPAPKETDETTALPAEQSEIEQTTTLLATHI
jgi:hypothetical protein